MKKDKQKSEDDSHEPSEINLNEYLSIENEQPRSLYENFGINNELWNNKDFLHELKIKGHVSLKFTTKKDPDGYPALDISSNINHPERFGLIPEVNNMYKQSSQDTGHNQTNKHLEVNPYVDVQTDEETGVVRIIVDLPDTNTNAITIMKKGKLLILKADTKKITYYKELILGKDFTKFEWTFNDGLLEIVVDTI